MLVTNGTLITWESASNRILEDHALLIENDRIKEMGTTSELRSRYPQYETLDARGQYAMPGNICAHTHFYGAYARGMAIPGAAPKDFPEILQKLWWPLDRSLDTESIRYSVLPCLVDAIKLECAPSKSGGRGFRRGGESADERGWSSKTSKLLTRRSGARSFD